MSRENMKTGSALMGAGVKIFPCREAGASTKAPYTRQGFKAATADPVARDRWSLMFPGAIWGLPCALNNILVLDADRHGKGDGVANLLTLFGDNQFDWRSVPTVATPSGGYHFYFNRPVAIGPTRATLCEAVDIRDNAYVIAPECWMPDGRSYRLVEGNLSQFAEAIATRCLPDPPAWMLPMLSHMPAPTWDVSSLPTDDETLKSQVKGLISAVLNSKEGNRNNLLHWASCRMAEMVRADLVALEDALWLLDGAGARIGLTMRETRATITSGFRKIFGGDHDAR